MSKQAPPWEVGTASKSTQTTTSVDKSLQAFAMRNAYSDCGSTKEKSSVSRDIAGYEPAAPGRYPVFVYLTGTLMKFNGPEAQFLTSEMAKRGFVSAAIDYDNAAYPYCPTMTAKASCIFDEKAETSALSKLCARGKADCSQGIVVAGFSQGANLAALSGNNHPQVRAAYLMGHGDRALNGLDVSRCADDAATRLLPSQMRSVNGESDMFFGARAPGVKKQLQKVVGLSCSHDYVCTGEGDSGFHIIANDDLKDGSADHCYFLNGANVYCSTYDGLDPTWQHGSAPWSAGPNLDWLAQQVTKR